MAVLLLTITGLGAEQEKRAYDGGRIASIECPKGWTASEGRKPKGSPGIVFGGLKGPEKAMIVFWTIDRNELELDQESGLKLFIEQLKIAVQDFKVVDSPRMSFGEGKALTTFAQFTLKDPKIAMKAYWVAIQDEDYVYVVQGSCHLEHAEKGEANILRAFKSFRLEANKALRLVRVNEVNPGTNEKPGR